MGRTAESSTASPGRTAGDRRRTGGAPFSEDGPVRREACGAARRAFGEPAEEMAGHGGTSRQRSPGEGGAGEQVDRILTAARKSFAERGYAEMSLRAVAKAADVDPTRPSPSRTASVRSAGSGEMWLVRSGVPACRATR
ncbi:helix-turn-helix domain-containing protein [Streptomyces sp. NPDC051109]|uniref:helix-turn-helix domain-containing protein n=1 Tax=Streptomyces sp. NPDC051109 TaxID=3365642 RepID=UPI0037BBC0A7